jgi:hypothetical protein
MIRPLMKVIRVASCYN